MPLVIDEVLGLLEAEWCDLREISERLGLTESEVKMILSFLVKYDFARLDEDRRRAKLSPSLLEFLERVRKVEEGKT